MNKIIEITSKDPILDQLDFKPRHNKVKRRCEQFVPNLGGPERLELTTSTGESLIAKPGDYLVSSLDDPDHPWPVDADIFETTYEMVSPGVCVKTAATELVPLVDVTNGDEDQQVTVHTLEGPETVRAGDFYLARGIKGEIWPYPKE
jgi:hypothetical protein